MNKFMESDDKNWVIPSPSQNNVQFPSSMLQRTIQLQAKPIFPKAYEDAKLLQAFVKSSLIIVFHMVCVTSRNSLTLFIVTCDLCV